jgi:hypothetical protein
MRLARLRPLAVLISVTSLAMVAWFVGLSGAASAAVTTLYVNGSSPACSDTGPGTSTQPFCTIVKGAAVVAAGQTLQVAAGTYGGDIVLGHSGTAGSPIVITNAPGATVTVSGGTNGFKLPTKSYVTLQGFTVQNTTSYGLYVYNGTALTVTNMRVTGAGQPAQGLAAYGFYFSGITSSTISYSTADHNSNSGFVLTGASTSDLITHNTSYSNAEGYQRAAAGIDVRSGPNTVSYNVTYSNEDSGIQFSTGANGCVAVGNVTYGNGDHGIDYLNAPNSVVVGNTVFGNVTSGINFEGSAAPASSGAVVANNVSVDNGIASPRTSGDIRVDTLSIPGTSIDYDLVWLSSAGTVMTWGTTTYKTWSAFRTAVPSQEVHGLYANPVFANASGNNFQLTQGSPAIDSANSAAPNEPTVDILGAARYDDPAVPNTGAGPRTYDDRGAYEFTG